MRNPLPAILGVLKLTPIYLVHKPLQLTSGQSIDFRLYGIMPLIGLVNFFANPRIHPIFLYFILLFTLSIAVGAVHQDFLSMRRSFQTLMMSWFCGFLINALNDDEFLRLAKNAFFFSAIFHCLQTIFGKHSNLEILEIPYLYEKIGFEWVQFVVEGIRNNANYTGLIFAVLGIYFFRQKLFGLFFLSMIFTVITLSKTAILVPIIYLFGHCFFKNLRKQMLFYSWLVITFTLSYPALITIYELVASTELKLLANSLSGGRYATHLSYMEMWRDNIHGVGYHLSPDQYRAYSNVGSQIVENNLFSVGSINFDPHSTFIRVLVELGIAGYLLLLVFCIGLFRHAQTLAADSALFIATILFAFLWLDGLNEFVFYFGIASLFHKRGVHLPKRALK